MAMLPSVQVKIKQTAMMLNVYYKQRLFAPTVRGYRLIPKDYGTKLTKAKSITWCSHNHQAPDCFCFFRSRSNIADFLAYFSPPFYLMWKYTCYVLICE